MLTIGRVAEKSQVTADTIRFYEREGLIKPAGKSVSGYRLYTDEAVRRIGFIKHAQQCGFSLVEIRELLELRKADDACCDDIYRVAAEKNLQLAAKIKALNSMSEALTRLMESCSHDKTSLDNCPILGALEAGVRPQQLTVQKGSTRKGHTRGSR